MKIDKYNIYLAMFMCANLISCSARKDGSCNYEIKSIDYLKREDKNLEKGNIIIGKSERSRDLMVIHIKFVNYSQHSAMIAFRDGDCKVAGFRWGEGFY